MLGAVVAILYTFFFGCCCIFRCCLEFHFVFLLFFSSIFEKYINLGEIDAVERTFVHNIQLGVSQGGGYI